MKPCCELATAAAIRVVRETLEFADPELCEMMIVAIRLEARETCLAGAELDERTTPTPEEPRHG